MSTATAVAQRLTGNAYEILRRYAAGTDPAGISQQLYGVSTAQARDAISRHAGGSRQRAAQLVAAAERLATPPRPGGAAPAPAPPAMVVPIRLDRLVAGPNARGDLGDVSELAASLRALGQLDPIQVCPTTGGRYEVIEGHRRLAAARLAGLGHLHALVRARPTAAERLITQVSIHTHRRGFDPIADARALEALMFEHGHSREDLARLFGRSPGWVRDRLALLALPAEEQQRVASRQTPVTVAVASRRGPLPAVGRPRRRPGAEVELGRALRAIATAPAGTGPDEMRQTARAALDAAGWVIEP